MAVVLALSEVVLCRPGQRAALANRMLHPSSASGGKTPALRLAGGTWIGTVTERVRDVVMTDGRLVEDHRLIRVVPLRAHARAERSFDTVITVCAFERARGPAAGVSEGAASDRAAHLAIARVLRNILSASWLDFDREYRVTVVPCSVSGAHPTWLPVAMPAGEPVFAGFAACSGIVSDVHRQVEGDGQRRVADVGLVLHLSRWVRENVALDAGSAPASVAETLLLRKGCPEARAVLLAVMARAIGAPACAVNTGDAWFVEVGVPVETKAAHIAAFARTVASLGLPASTAPATVERDGASWVRFDPASPGLVPPPAVDDQARRIIPSNPFTDWRIVVYRPRSGELDSYDQIGASFSRDFAKQLLPACLDLLGACDCEDGCSSCCGGLGTVPAASVRAGAWDSGMFDESDMVSRQGAIALLTALVGRPPEEVKSTPVVAGGILGLVAQAIGTRAAHYRNGIWTKLFNQYMPLDPAWVASARWMKPGEDAGKFAGLYWPGTKNEVLIKPGLEKDETLRVIIHEYAHNWQFKGDFDYARLATSDDAKQFYLNGSDSNFIIEGHARWVDTVFRHHRGMGAAYTPSDGAQWNEYKTGFFLIEGIVGAFGVSGLYRWLSRTPEAGSPPKSRDKRLKWPFTIEDAVTAFGLEEEARSGTFDGIDVQVEVRTGLGEGDVEAKAEGEPDA